MLRFLLFSIILGLVCLAGAGLAYRHALSVPVALEQETIVEVRQGDSLASVLNKLEASGIIQTQWPAKVYARLKNIDSSIQTGEVQFVSGMRLPDILNQLVSAERVQYAVTLVEGQTVEEVIKMLRSDERLGDQIASKSASDWTELAQPYEHLEGLLFPDTYYFQRGDSDWDIVLRARSRMSAVLDELWAERSLDLPYQTPYEALIMASIIEKETGVPRERPDIAGVFVRRLNKGMRLQTDPTVIYGLGNDYQGNLTRAHLKQATPYNTYVIKGLPPTPIALAGSAAIEAALHPASGDAYYFVAKGDGSHYFSQTLAEHQKAVRNYQINNRREQYRSSPNEGN